MSIETGSARPASGIGPKPLHKSFWNVPTVIIAGSLAGVAILLGLALHNSWNDGDLGSQPVVEKTL